VTISSHDLTFDSVDPPLDISTPRTCSTSIPLRIVYYIIKSRNESFVASPEIEGRNAVEADYWARHKKTFYSE
jgi:hypothetical protein